MATLVSRNINTGEIIKEIPLTSQEDLNGFFDRAKVAQAHWCLRTTRQRAKYLLQLRETLLEHTDELVELISAETGKPKIEALANEILPAFDMLTYFSKKTRKLLRSKTIPLSLMKHRKSYLQFWPLGVVVIISPWNYPFLLPFSQILMALSAGNAILFKPSEVTVSIGLKIQEICNEAGLPLDVLQTVVGDGRIGEALILHKPNKVFFTGSVAVGKKIMETAAKQLIPLNLELGGKDAMVILPDADLDYATSAALWGSFCNSGQACASVERIYVHERMIQPFLQKLTEKALKLRSGPSLSFENDLGPLTLEKQKSIYIKQLEEAKSHQAKFLSGGELSADGQYLPPTIAMEPPHGTLEHLQLHQEETFGPIVTVSAFKSLSEAIHKVNQSKYGLTACVITKNLSLGEDVAKQLAVGTVMINETVYTAGLGETPWGGVKESGFGRTHADIGLYEFVNIRHIHKPTSRLFTWKAPWWFPYSTYQYATFRYFVEIYRKHWIDKLRGLAHLLWNLVHLLKREPRL